MAVGQRHEFIHALVLAFVGAGQVAIMDAPQRLHVAPAQRGKIGLVDDGPEIDFRRQRGIEHRAHFFGHGRGPPIGLTGQEGRVLLLQGAHRRRRPRRRGEDQRRAQVRLHHEAGRRENIGQQFVLKQAGPMHRATIADLGHHEGGDHHGQHGQGNHQPNGAPGLHTDHRKPFIPSGFSRVIAMVVW
jgi:hypothetical protein